jgi:hypothetical protein
MISRESVLANLDVFLSLRSFTRPATLPQSADLIGPPGTPQRLIVRRPSIPRHSFSDAVSEPGAPPVAAMVEKPDLSTPKSADSAEDDAPTDTGPFFPS